MMLTPSGATHGQAQTLSALRVTPPDPSASAGRDGGIGGHT